MSANKSVIKTLKILDLISKSPDGMTLSEIYKELDLPKATVYDILQALYQEDAVYYKNEIQKTYVIGSKVFAIGQSYSKNSNFIAFASPLLKDFADKYGVTTFAYKRIGTKVTSVFKSESPKSRLSTPDVGQQISLYDNIVGLCFLTFLPQDKANDLISRILKKDIKNKNGAFFKNIMDQINKNKNIGYILDNGVTEAFVCNLAVPVYNFEKKMTGVIYATRLMFDENSEDLDNYLKDFLQIASIISSKQGYKR